MAATVLTWFCRTNRHSTIDPFSLPNQTCGSTWAPCNLRTNARRRNCLSHCIDCAARNGRQNIQFENSKKNCCKISRFVAWLGHQLTHIVKFFQCLAAEWSVTNQFSNCWPKWPSNRSILKFCNIAKFRLPLSGIIILTLQNLSTHGGTDIIQNLRLNLPNISRANRAGRTAGNTRNPSVTAFIFWRIYNMALPLTALNCR